MRHPRSRSLKVSSLVGLLAMVAAPVAASTPVTLHVGPGGGLGPCAAPAFASIQDAVNASGRRDTILVCPGRYDEKVTIQGSGHDGLKIRSVVQWKATIRSGSSAFVEIKGADRVRLVGLRFRLPAEPCVGLLWGIRVAEDSQDVVIRANRIVSGRDDSLGECAIIDGVQVDGGSSAWIGYNTIRDPVYTGIGIEGTATVLRNSIRFWHTGESETGTGYAGIEVVLAGQARVIGNAVTGLASSGISTPLLEHGILVRSSAPGSVVRRNLVRHTEDGLVGRTSHAFAFGRNTVLDSRAHGILVVESTDAVVRANTSLRSTLFDCTEADSTDITWADNIGATDDPEDLCEPPAP